MNARFAPSPAEMAERPRHLIQGEYFVTADPAIVLTTTLGSCIAACLYDASARVGGMNHFLLPENEDVDSRQAAHYGAYAMELLINGLLQAGAHRNRLEAKLFGGAHLADRLTDVGAKNIAFAKHFLAREAISFQGGSVGGDRARRIQFWPASGRARQLALNRIDVDWLARETAVDPLPKNGGAVDFFES
jgi:chemotaxis protein CheD